MPTGPTDGSWSPKTRLAAGPRQACGVAALNGEVYVVGGFSDTGTVGRVEVYTPATNA